MQDLRILRKIRKEFDYEAYCEENYSVKHTARGDEIRICCPHCGESKYKCYVNNDKKRFNCFKCRFDNGNFDVFDFVAITEGIPRGKAVLKLMHEFAPTTPLTIEEIYDMMKGKYHEVDEDEEGPTAKLKLIDGLPKEAYPLTEPNAPGQGKFWAYLMNRGLTEQEVRACKIHYIPRMKVPVEKIDGQGHKKFVGDIGRRIVFPIYGPGGLVSWLTRPITDTTSNVKYINCPDSELSRTIWPFVEPYEDIAVLTEGIFDALAVRRLGSPFSSYCTFGKKVAYDQLKMLIDWGVTSVILFWDTDAKKDMMKEVENLKMKFDEVYVPNFSEWPSDCDAGDMLKLGDEGIVHLEKALCEPVHVSSLDYIRWQFEG